MILMIRHRAKEAIPVSSRSAWLLVGFLGVALFLNNSDRHTVFSIFPVLKADLKFTDLQLGLTGSIFLWVYAICNPIAGQLGDRYSKRKLVTWSVILFSGVTVLTGLARTPWMMLFCRALLGVTESLFMPCAIALIVTCPWSRHAFLRCQPFRGWGVCRCCYGRVVRQLCRAGIPLALDLLFFGSPGHSLRDTLRLLLEALRG